MHTQSSRLVSLAVLFVLAGAACRKPVADTSAESAAAGATTAAKPATPGDSATAAGVTPPAAPGISQPSTSTPPTASTQPTAAKNDTLRGTVDRVGNDPVSVIVLRVSGNGAANLYALRSSARTLLDAAVGLEVVVSGATTNDREMQASPRGAPVFEVRHFEVRAADGVAAVDGTIGMQNGTFFITTIAGKRVDTPHLPAALRSQIGARVFLAGPLSQPPASYGVISAKP